MRGKARHHCYFVPYDAEITPRERAGMQLLERIGEVIRDESGLKLHWHRRTDGRS